MDSEVQLELRKYVTPEIVFGSDARMLSGRYARNFGLRKVLVVTDPGVQAAHWPGDVLRSLEAEGIEHCVFAHVTPNPREEDVAQGSALYMNEQCDGIIAIGGGSVLDCAKGIGIVSTNQLPILSFEGVDRISLPMPPLICVPTTGGTSADLSQFAIFVNRPKRLKFAVISKAVVPDVALIDPVPLTTMDPYLTACTGLDALAHAIEAFTSNGSSPITDVHALEGIRLISRYLIASVHDPANVPLRGKVMAGSMHAGLAFSNAGLGAVHAMAHSVGGFQDLAHGECNALLLEHVAAFNFEVSEDRYLAIGAAMDLDLRGMTNAAKKRKILESFASMRQELGIVGTLSERGIKSSDVPELTGRALRDPCLVTNPRVPNQRDIETLYEEAL